MPKPEEVERIIRTVLSEFAFAHVDHETAIAVRARLKKFGLTSSYVELQPGPPPRLQVTAGSLRVTFPSPAAVEDEDE